MQQSIYKIFSLIDNYYLNQCQLQAYSHHAVPHNDKTLHTQVVERSFKKGDTE